VNYPHRTDAEQAALDRLHTTPYALDDAPYLKTQRITLSSDYDNANLTDKAMVDTQGVADNWYHYERNRVENKAGRT
jgi:hypothetical protein